MCAWTCQHSPLCTICITVTPALPNSIYFDMFYFFTAHLSSIWWVHRVSTALLARNSGLFFFLQPIGFQHRFSADLFCMRKERSIPWESILLKIQQLAMSVTCVTVGGWHCWLTLQWLVSTHATLPLWLQLSDSDWQFLRTEYTLK